MIIPVFAVISAFNGILLAAAIVLCALVALVGSEVLYAIKHKKCFGQWVCVVVTLAFAVIMIGGTVYHAYSEGGSRLHVACILLAGLIAAMLFVILQKQVRHMNITHYGPGNFDHV